MITNGKPDGLSAMAKTVGFTMAAASKLVLEDKIKIFGVKGPF